MYIKNFILIWIFIFNNVIAQTLPAPTLKEGFPIRLCDDCKQASIVGSPRFYDLNNDSTLEIIVSSHKCVFVIQNNGISLSGWPKCFNQYVVDHNAAIGDIDGDGYPEIVIVTYEYIGPNGSLYALRADGEVVNGFPVNFTYNGGVYNPVLYDMGVDGKLEIFFRAGQYIYAYDHQGNLLPGWPQGVSYGKLVGSVIVSDLDFDGKPEIFAGSTKIPPADTMVSFAINVWNPDGTIKPGWPFIVKNRYFSCNQLGAVGNFPEDSIKVLCFTTSRYPPVDIYETYVLNSNGEIIPGWPQRMLWTPYWVSGVTMLDLYKAGIPEVIIAGDFWRHFYAWEIDGRMLPKFPIGIGLAGSFYGNVATVPIVYHDIENRDFVMFAGTSVTEGDSGFFVAMKSDSTPAPWSMLKLYGLIHSSPAFADLEGDGSIEMAIVTLSMTLTGLGKEQYLYVYEFKGIPFDKRHFPWPISRANRWNTGEFGFEPTDTVVVAVRSEKGLPTKTRLLQNYPNPFNASTKIKYEIDKQTKVKICIYNTIGQKISTLVDAEQQAGIYEAVFNGDKYPSGVYYAKLETPEYTNVKKLILMR